MDGMGNNMSRRSFLAGAASLALAAAVAPATAHAAGSALQAAGPAAMSTQAKKKTKKKPVVVYFSCTGTTAGAAKRIAKATGAKLVRVKAKQPYTDADLDYDDEDSRVSVEHASASSPAKSKVRPAIANLKAIKTAVKSASVVYIGYPIWWGEAPHIMYTLVEALSLKGKTVVPFCTSAASGTGSSAKHLKSRASTSKKTKWKTGKSFYGVPSQKAVSRWVAKL